MAGPHDHKARCLVSETGKTLVGTAILAGVLAACLAVALPAVEQDPLGRQAVALAAATAGIGAIGGWLVGRMGRRGPPGIAVGAALGAILVRIGPPLIVLAWLSSAEGGIRKAGAGGYLVSFYLALLASDLLLNIMGRQKTSQRGGVKIAN
jgi:hypothetical protein